MYLFHHFYFAPERKNNSIKPQKLVEFILLHHYFLENVGDKTHEKLYEQRFNGS